MAATKRGKVRRRNPRDKTSTPTTKFQSQDKAYQKNKPKDVTSRQLFFFHVQEFQTSVVCVGDLVE
jgi:hypothetical protein